MLGHNKLELNAATMEQAVQEWLDKRLKSTDGSATKVSFITPRHTGGSWTYEIGVTQEQPNTATEEPK